MVNPVNPNDPSQSMQGSQNTPKAAGKPTPANQQPTESEKHDGMFMSFKKMFPAASDVQIKQMVDNWQKCIGDQISRDQKFHEEQEDERKAQEDQGS